MTPSGAVLDRTDAPDTTEVPDAPAPNLFLYRFSDSPVEEPIPTRDEVFQAMYELGVTDDEAVAIYDMFKELAERLRILHDSGSTLKALFESFRGLRSIVGADDSTYLVYTQLENDDPRHPALMRIMVDDVLSEDGTETHRLLEQHFLPDGKHRFAHGFSDGCLAGITRR